MLPSGTNRWYNRWTTLHFAEVQLSGTLGDDLMAFLWRQKAVVAVLVLYWPTLFVLAHIPVPQVVRRAHVYDKSLHLLAYMILTFLLWSAIKPLERVCWRRAAVWCLLAGVVPTAQAASTWSPPFLRASGRRWSRRRIF